MLQSVWLGWSLLQSLPRLVNKRPFTGYLYRSLFPATLILALVVGYFLVQSFFIVNTVMFTENLELLPNIDMLRGKNILLLQEKDVIEALTKTNYQLASLYVEKILPSTFILKPRYRTSVAQIVQGNHVFVIDGNGIVFMSSILRVSNIPMIEADVDKLSVGSKFEEIYTSSVFQALVELQHVGISIKHVLIKNKEEIVFISDDGLIISSTTISPQKLATSLQIMLRGLKIEGKKPSSIDVRFDKPIIHF